MLKQIETFSNQFHVADDTEAVSTQLVSLIDSCKIGGKQVHDANIVATMLANEIPCLITHNTKDFKRFDSLITLETL